jgi:hypothetical protein
MVRQVSCSPAAYHSSSAAHTQAALDEAQGDVVCGLHFMAGAVSLELLREQLFSHLNCLIARFGREGPPQHHVIYEQYWHGGQAFHPAA